MTFKSSACDIWLLRSRAIHGRPGGVARRWIGRALLDGGRMHRGGVIPQVLAIAPFALRDLFSVDRNVARRLDADADLRSVHRHDGYFNVVADSQGFAGSSRQYEHDVRSRSVIGILRL